MHEPCFYRHYRLLPLLYPYRVSSQNDGFRPLAYYPPHFFPLFSASSLPLCHSKPFPDSSTIFHARPCIILCCLTSWWGRLPCRLHYCGIRTLRVTARSETPCQSITCCTCTISPSLRRTHSSQSFLSLIGPASGVQFVAFYSTVALYVTLTQLDGG